MEDGLVHCIKPGRVAVDAAAVILAEIAMLQLTTRTTWTNQIPLLVKNDKIVIDDN